MRKFRVKRRQTEALMNAKLHPERDKDLIDWWTNLPYGGGSAELKTAAREYIAKGADAAPATQADIAKLTGQLETLVRLVAHLTQKIERGVVVQGAATPQTEAEAAQLSEAEAQQRKKKIESRGW